MITAWSYVASGTASALKFQVGRLVDANTYRIVGASPLVAPAMSQLNTYNDVRISVQPGDLIGLYMTTGGFCTQFNPEYTGALRSGGEVLPGADGVFTDRASFIYDVSARLEPDADGDGFGDETQDLCSTDARRQTTCPTPPETTIVGAPKKKIGKPKAKFSFESSEAGSTFNCRLKGRNLSSVVKQLGPCTSPTKYTGLARGKYKFLVLATDAAGSPDRRPPPGSSRSSTDARSLTRTCRRPVALAATAILAAQASAAPAVDGEFPIPGGVGTDNDIIEGPDGNMWVTLQNVNGVARITPAGVVTEFPARQYVFRNRRRPRRQPLGLDHDRRDQGPARRP